MATVIAYVDGFNLYYGLREKFGRRYLWLDLVKLVQRLRPKDDIVKVKYFTAAVRNQPESHRRQQTYLAALAVHCGDRLDVTLGRYQEKHHECRNCKARWTSYEEKETDVNIAVSLVADAAQEAADIALIISADSDLCPAIRTARTINRSRTVPLGMIAAFPPKRYSHEVKSLIKGAFTISQADIRNSLLPDLVIDPETQREHHRPPKWR